MQVLLFSENTLKAVKRGTTSFLAKDAIGSFQILTQYFVDLQKNLYCDKPVKEYLGSINCIQCAKTVTFYSQE